MTAYKPESLMWFRQDLRLHDNPALYHAAQRGPVLAVYIIDPHASIGDASQVWRYQSLYSLQKSLCNCLGIYQGDPLLIIKMLIDYYDIKHLYYNDCHEPDHIKYDTQIQQHLLADGMTVHNYHDYLLWPPFTISKVDGSAYQVFTPFYRKCLQAPPPRTPLPKPQNMRLCPSPYQSISINKLAMNLNVHWKNTISKYWKIGEPHAEAHLSHFLKTGLAHYKEGRNFPDKPYVSRLSAHLHFGEISVNRVWHAVRSKNIDHNTDHFCSELGWREFSYYLLYHHPNLPTQNIQQQFDAFPWEDNPHFLHSWQAGQTGIPIIDAGMRELWETGYMHNRIRMVVASFLVKNLQQHWQAGKAWFWHCLVDADLASNSVSWQWVAGCGADAAPYFRIFNPILQGEKFDPEGHYTKRWVPELQNMPTKNLFAPWQAPNHVLKQAGVILGQNYPHPIIDLRKSRNKALLAYKSMRR